MCNSSSSVLVLKRTSPSLLHTFLAYTTQLSIAIQHTGSSFLHQNIPRKRPRASSCLFIHFGKNMGASLRCVKWSEPRQSGYNTLFDQNLLCCEERSLDYYRSANKTITQKELCHEIYRKIQTMGASSKFTTQNDKRRYK